LIKDEDIKQIETGFAKINRQNTGTETKNNIETRGTIEDNKLDKGLF
jgi:hypothetical protein